MRAVKRWRYYCDFCNKSLGTKQAMVWHEQSCTMNPNRVCRMCEHVKDWRDDEPKQRDEIIGYLQSAVVHDEHDEFVSWRWRPGLSEAEVVDRLRELCGQCPVCMLAMIRQSGLPPYMFEHWKMKADMAEIWEA